MIYMLLRRCKLLIRRHTWLTIFLALLALHTFSVLAMLIFDYHSFAGPTVAHTLWNGTWWFFSTATTVGYGDIVPKTIVGQAIAIADMIFGIGLMFAFIGAGYDRWIERRSRALKGLMQYRLKNHIVILGGGAHSKLEVLVAELLSDPVHKEMDVVVCSDGYDENPLPYHIRFVKGKIGSSDVHAKACAKTANFVIVYGYSDEETILTAMAIDEINRRAQIAVYIRDRDNIVHIERINKIRKDLNEGEGRYLYPPITVITRINDLMLAREVSDPDLSSVILELVNSKVGKTFFSIQAWSEMGVCVAVKEVRRLLRNTVGNALLIGIKRYETDELELNPLDSDFVCPKDYLFVIACQRPFIDWSQILQ